MKYLLTTLLSIITMIAFAQNNFIPGYERSIKGGSITYHSPQEDAGEALLVRSESIENYIEWESSIIPQDLQEQFVNFNLMMAIDVNPQDPHSWTIQVNNRTIFTIFSPNDTLNKSIQIEGEEGSLFNFNATQVDKYGDLIGYVTIRIPVNLIEKGMAAKFKIIGESAGSSTWFMIYKYKTIERFKIQAENAIRKGSKNNERVVKLEIVYYKEGAKAEIQLGNQRIFQSLNYGYNRSFVTFDADTSEKTLSYAVSVDGKILDEGEITIKPIKQMTIYLIHHSHVDIGFTHIQTEVEEKQWGYIEQCISLAESSLSYPKEAQFKWNIEVMWALDSYWKKCNPEQKDRLKIAIQKNWIELDAFYGNELTGLCSSEELMYLMSSAREIAKECSVELTAAMISDIPGWSWGIVPALSQSGVKYLSLGTNTFHRIGYTIEEWGDKPFYWQSASGKEKVLTWIHAKGYSSFHTGLGAENIVNKLDEEILLTYMNELRDKEYPYEKVILRYNIGSDNGPPDVMLSEKVKNWNERYISPKLVISTTSAAFSAFEETYKEVLPVVNGDFTGYWEDGAASSAHETSINRESAHIISQAQTLMAMNHVKYSKSEFDNAWQKVMLFNEHTWGSWNSISAPQSDFTKQQWAIKQAFAVDGMKIAKELKQNALKNRFKIESDYYDIINSHSWPVTDVVKIPAIHAKNYNSIKDENGNLIKSQKLKDGSLIFISESIPGFSSKRCQLFAHIIENKVTLESNNETIESDYFKLILEKNSGVVKELLWKKKNLNLVSNGKFAGLNEYIYVEGRHAENQTKASDATIIVEDIGAVMISIKVIYKNIKGCNELSTTYKLYNGIERIDIVNEIDKKEIYQQEAVHFAFPFNVPNGILRYDLAYGVCQSDKDQIKGSNRNFITIENWVDISNQEYGLTWISKDAPLIEVGDIYNDPTTYGYLKELPTSQTVISYVMNNYWETNFLAAQGGKIKFNYSIYLHEAYSPAFSEKRALEVQEPLVVIPVNNVVKPKVFDLALDNENIIIQSVVPQKEDGLYLIRIFNAGSASETLTWKKTPSEVFNCDLNGDHLRKLNDSLILVPMDVITLLVKL